MGKTEGFIRLKGTLNDLTFYKSADGNLVRTKGGVSASRIKSDPAFQRTRENGTEFAEITSAGKMLRMAVGPMLFHARDRRLTSRLVAVMARIKNLDSVSARGERNVAIGITTAEGKALLTGFDFNGHAALSSVFYPPISVDTSTGVVTVDSFIPKQQILAPEGATHFSMQSAFVHINFETGKFDTTYSPAFNHALDMTATTVTLTPSGVPGAPAVSLYLVLVEFFQEVNGVQYSLNNGAYNVLNVLEVV